MKTYFTADLHLGHEKVAYHACACIGGNGGKKYKACISPSTTNGAERPIRPTDVSSGTAQNAAKHNYERNGTANGAH